MKNCHKLRHWISLLESSALAKAKIAKLLEGLIRPRVIETTTEWQHELIKIYINPSQTTMEHILKSAKLAGEARFVAFDNNIAVASAYDAIHADIRRALCGHGFILGTLGYWYIRAAAGNSRSLTIDDKRYYNHRIGKLHVHVSERYHGELSTTEWPEALQRIIPQLINSDHQVP